MRTRKQELVSDDLKPFVCGIIKEYREKYNYSLEDLARALNYKKNRQTLHKYETGTLNIPYEIFFDIAEIFNISSDVIKDIPMTREEEELFEKKLIKNYVNTLMVIKMLLQEEKRLLILIRMLHMNLLVNNVLYLLNLLMIQWLQYI